MTGKRIRMMVEIPPEIRMAIQLRSVKDRVKTGDVVDQAIRIAFGEDVNEAAEELIQIENAERRVAARMVEIAERELGELKKR